MELDLLKKNWQKIDFDLEQKNASSIKEIKGLKSIITAKTITKKLFRYSLIEFSLWGVAAIGLQYFFQEFTPQSFLDFQPLIYIEKLNFVVLIAFLALFFWSFKSINTTNNILNLITRIFRVKKVVKGYITFNLIIFNLTFLMSYIWELNNNEEIAGILKNESSFMYLALLLFGATFAIIFTLLVYRAYNFIYGRFILNFDDLTQNLKHLIDRK
ncbi:hypothetical protein [[Muricauda] lutisoli]|uniref:Beta-carotene 15,15'-monooxygenase n=1 Tax=[Muricauda] lutisoli TaxID=2816035 RepID=A0ABS3EUQ1_9FLAO|nr:hypothetical protein [[Muricauda] lutisoli]MBO0329976.1 hypothetical protein [[Muricauda] lutisoli]